MRILVLGGDGYLGWPTALHLSAVGHDVGVADSFVRRQYDAELGVDSLVPIRSLSERVGRWADLSGRRLAQYIGDLCDASFVHEMVRDFQPDTIVHFAEQRSAPYSMIDQQHAVYTQNNNVVGTLNVLYAIADINRDIHLVKLGTMGEYGTPNIDIEEGWLTVTHQRGPTRFSIQSGRDRFTISPRFTTATTSSSHADLGPAVDRSQPGGRLRSAHGRDLLDPGSGTAIRLRPVFGTVLNRFVIQAVLGHPLTVYGRGGQTRGIINLVDTVECIRLASENPAEPGEFRVFNQFTEQMSVREIADTVASAYPGRCTIEEVENPRVEMDGHYYRAAHTRLLDLGLAPHLLSESLIDSMFAVAERYKARVNLDAVRPTIQWRTTASELAGPG